MREAFGDIWALAAAEPEPVVCVTTNLQVDRVGDAVMGGGIAREARDQFPGVAKALGQQLRLGRKQTTYLGMWSDLYGLKYHLIAFPTKDHWRFNSKLALIESSARELVALADGLEFSRVFLPRPGCGLGGRKWEDVGPILSPLLDDRFTVVGFAREDANAHAARPAP